jgi:hypothetical protein
MLALWGRRRRAMGFGSFTVACSGSAGSSDEQSDVSGALRQVNIGRKLRLAVLFRYEGRVGWLGEKRSGSS